MEIFDFLKEITFLGNPVWNWIVCALHILVAFALRFIIKTIIQKIVNHVVHGAETNFTKIILNPVMSVIVLVGFRVGFMHLDFSDDVNLAIQRLFSAATTLVITWVISRLLQCIIDYFFSRRKGKHTANEEQIVSLLSKTLSSLVWILGVVTAINNVGYDVGTLIAGLGIGGLAMALAAQNTASNIFGGFTIFLDKPFTLHERIRIGGYDGTVETIGLRNIRLRTLSGTQVSIPNSTITDSMVENVTREPSRKVTVALGLVYETTHEQMKKAMDTLHQIVEDNQDRLEKGHSVFFDSFGDSSLNITFIYYIRKRADIFQTQSDMNLEILHRFNDLGLSFAFPSQTLYFDKESFHSKS